MGITLTNSPEEALHEADIVVTDTWSGALPTTLHSSAE